MAAFHEVQFPSTISYGSRGGPARLTQIVKLKSGFEERNQSWEHSRRKYDAALGLRKIEYLHDIVQFWEARRGQLYGFRWKDWTDFSTGRGTAGYTPTDVVIATGDGVLVEFQLVKRYADVGGEYARPINKPVAGEVVISLDDVAQGAGWSVDTATGKVTFDVAPGVGVVIKAGFEFDVPARFDSASIAVSVDAFQAGAIPAINVIEIRV